MGRGIVVGRHLRLHGEHGGVWRVAFCRSAGIGHNARGRFIGLIGDPGLASYRQALALSVILMLVCAGLVSCMIERLRVAGVA